MYRLRVSTNSASESLASIASVPGRPVRHSYHHLARIRVALACRHARSDCRKEPRDLASPRSRALDNRTACEGGGLSRSALIQRFTRYLAEPPMAYLTRWRLQLAARALISTPHSVADIAADVGYQSEAAFNRAFRRKFGEPPARFRKLQRSSPA